MKLSELRILYEVLKTKENVDNAIQSMRNGYVSLFDIEREDYIEHDGLYYCSHDYITAHDGSLLDYDDAVFCEGNEEWFHVDDTVYVYEGRNDNRYSLSWVQRGDFIRFNGSYYDDDALSNHDIVYVEDIGEYGYADDNYYNEDDGCWYSENKEEYVRGYHNGCYQSLDFDGKSKYKIGYEIEKEDEDVKESIYIDDFENKTNGLWRKERDGSLDDCKGFELISPTFELNIDNIFEHIEGNPVLVRHIDANISSSCGGHIHLSEEGLSGEELFNKIKGYTPLFYALYYGRVNKTYCKGKNNEDLKNENEKYQAIKIHHNRVEFRIISAVPNVTTLKWRTKLLMMILQYPTDSVIRAYYNVDTKFTKILKQTYSDDKLVELKDRFIKFTKQFENLDIKK
jgi:hypothetical protein